MNSFLPYVFTFSLLFSQFYTFSDNIRLTESLNDQKFPEVAIDSNYIHLTWVSVAGINPMNSIALKAISPNLNP